MKNLIYIFSIVSFLISTHITAQDNCNNQSIDFNYSENNIPTNAAEGSGPFPPPPPPPFEDERIVGYIHGISGGSNTWVSARNWTEETYELAVTPTELYYNMDNLKDASARIQEQMNIANINHVINTNSTYDYASSFLVAHSLGGLVSRDIEYRTLHTSQSDWQQQFGGLITFGTPHQGTGLVNNSELAIEIAQEGCSLASATYVSQFIEENFSNLGVLSGFVKNFLYSITLESDDELEDQGISIQGIVCDNILSFVLNSAFSGMLPQIASDMSPDSDELAKLNSHDFTLPLIVCYGLEDDPVSLRQIVATQNNIDEYDFGTANLENEEQEIIDDFTDYLLGLEASYDFYSNLEIPWYVFALNIAENAIEGSVVGNIFGQLVGSVIGAVVGAIFGIFENSNAPNYDLIAFSYLAYWNWALKFDENYRLVMDLDDVTTEFTGTNTVYECTLNGVIIDSDIDLTDLVDISDIECGYVDYPIYSVISNRYESDGTVRANSAKLCPHSNTFLEFDMPGSNHVQLKNDKNTARILIDIFKGDYPSTKYFTLLN